MCTNYTPTRREKIAAFKVAPPAGPDWPADTWQDYAAPIIRSSVDGQREAIIATYGIVPKRKIPAGVKKFSTMNARAETVGTLRSYSSAWRQAQLCLVPLTRFYEPNWETGKHIRWGIGMADGSDFAVAGLWRAWAEDDGSVSHSFTQLTVNADEHSVMKHFHRPDDEKRSLVIVPPSEYDAWLGCQDPEVARSFLNLYPADLMAASPAPMPAKEKIQAPTLPPSPSGETASLF